MKESGIMTEQLLYDEIRQAIADGKKAMRKARRSFTALMEINTEAKRLEAANAAMGLRGKVSAISGALDEMHCQATIDLRALDPNAADGIQTKGPGGR
jgi:hypothetical protein